MRFEITGQDWSILGGTWCVPSGTVIDSASDDVWSVRARGLTPPFNSKALDQQAWEAQLAAYPDHVYLLGGAWR
jgi:hypothetical protein